MVIKHRGYSLRDAALFSLLFIARCLKRIARKIHCDDLGNSRVLKLHEMAIGCRLHVSWWELFYQFSHFLNPLITGKIYIKCIYKLLFMLFT